MTYYPQDLNPVRTKFLKFPLDVPRKWWYNTQVEWEEGCPDCKPRQITVCLYEQSSSNPVT